MSDIEIRNAKATSEALVAQNARLDEFQGKLLEMAEQIFMIGEAFTQLKEQSLREMAKNFGHGPTQ